MRRFKLYRPNPPDSYYAKGTANPPNEPQLEGVVFSDGTVAIRWLTEFRSFSLWQDLNTFLNVHGHPEYDTKLIWLD